MNRHLSTSEHEDSKCHSVPPSSIVDLIVLLDEDSDCKKEVDDDDDEMKMMCEIDEDESMYSFVLSDLRLDRRLSSLNCS